MKYVDFYIYLILFLVGESKYCSAIACWTHPVAFRVLVRGRGFDASSSIAQSVTGVLSVARLGSRSNVHKNYNCLDIYGT